MHCHFNSARAVQQTLCGNDLCTAHRTGPQLCAMWTLWYALQKYDALQTEYVWTCRYEWLNTGKNEK